eukprot:SAG11_NODE_208_length_12354_cov_19.490167_7_plen_90_part_00
MCTAHGRRLRWAECGCGGGCGTVATVADNIDDDVGVKSLPPLRRQLRDVGHRLGVVAVHMEDRRPEGPADVLPHTAWRGAEGHRGTGGS